MVTQACLSACITSNHTDPACGAEAQRTGKHSPPSYRYLSSLCFFLHVFQKDSDSLLAFINLVSSRILSSPLFPLSFSPCPSCQSLSIWDLVILCSHSSLIFTFLLSKPPLQFSLTSDLSFCSISSVSHFLFCPYMLLFACFFCSAPGVFFFHLSFILWHFHSFVALKLHFYAVAFKAHMPKWLIFGAVSVRWCSGSFLTFVT